MTDNRPCRFCKSEAIRVRTPYLDVFGEPEYTWCCQAQKTNAEYMERFSEDDRPDREDIETI